MSENFLSKLRLVLQYTILLIALSYFLFPYFPQTSFFLFGKRLFITQILMIVALVFAFTLGLSKKWTARKINPKVLRIALWLLFALLVVGLSTLINQGLSSQTIVRLVSVISIVIILILFSLLERRFIDKFLIMAAWVTIAASILGILQFYFLGDILAPAAYFGFADTVFFASGFANYPTLFGAHLALFLPLFWGLGLTNYRNHRALWLTTFMVGVPALLLTFSRSSYLGALIGFLIVFVWAMRQDIRRKVIFSSLITTALLVFLSLSYHPPAEIQTSERTLYGSSGAIMKKRLQFGDESAQSRPAFSEVAMRLITRSPGVFLFGYGSQGFWDHWYEFRPPGVLEKYNKRFDPHSTFLETLVGGGFVALVLFAGFLVALYRGLVGIVKREPLAVPIIAGLTAILVDGLFHTHLYTKYLWIIVGVALALIYQYGKEETKPSQQ